MRFYDWSTAQRDGIGRRQHSGEFKATTVCPGCGKRFNAAAMSQHRKACKSAHASLKAREHPPEVKK